MKNSKKTLIVLIVILITVTIVSYFIYQEFRLQFEGQINGILTSLIALVGIMVTFSLNYQSLKNIEKQRMLQRPLLFLRRLDFENHIELRLQNKGLGPSVITSLILKDSKGNKYKGVYDAIEDFNLPSYTFTGDIDGLVLSANKKKVLFKLTESCPDFDDLRIKIKERFNDLDIVIKHEDIYEEKMPDYKCKLSWFGRDIKK